MYERSKLTGNIYHNGILVIADDRLQDWNDYVLFVQNGGLVVEIEATPQEIAEAQAKEVLENETKLYLKRATDGLSEYSKLSAEFRIAKLNGWISEETQRDIERALIPVRNEVLAGQWISAKNELELLGSEIIGASLYIRLYNQINNYINDNY
jgi:hypothetical protein